MTPEEMIARKTDGNCGTLYFREQENATDT